MGALRRVLDMVQRRFDHGRNLSGEYVANGSSGLPTRNNANEYIVVLRLPSEYPRLELELTPENRFMDSTASSFSIRRADASVTWTLSIVEENGYNIRETEKPGDTLDFAWNAAKEGVSSSSLPEVTDRKRSRPRNHTGGSVRRLRRPVHLRYGRLLEHGCGYRDRAAGADGRLLIAR